MIPFIFLDAGPLSLLTQRAGHRDGDACQAWLADVLSSASRVFVPEIADYELRRELHRSGKLASVARLDLFNGAESDRYIVVTTLTLRRAALLWAEARNRGIPTASRESLDADVILAAQVLEKGLPLTDVLVATSNVAHLARFVPAENWERIR